MENAARPLTSLLRLTWDVGLELADVTIREAEERFPTLRFEKSELLICAF